MQEKPLVSVICLCFNHSQFVLESLNSVKSQTHSNIELIILDDCSEDNSAEIIEEWLLNYPEILFIKNKTNIGNIKSFNHALKLAKGDYIIDLAADDLLLSNCIENQLIAFEKSKYKNLGAVYGNAEIIDEKGTFLNYYFEVNESKKVLKNRVTGNIYASILSGGNSMCSVSALMRSEVYTTLLGYDENLYYEDLDLWIRASRLFEFDFIDEILVQKRVVTNSHGSKFHKKKNALAKKINDSTVKILKKAIALNKSKEEHKAILKRIHYEMILNFKNSHYSLVLNYIFLELLVRFKIATT
jgi:glycosyltransferase involved in cell wall biosynthesis